ncbi:MAG: hypothetical protein ACHQAY_11045 [Hyphomicrobiales bacterium]
MLATARPTRRAPQRRFGPGNASFLSAGARRIGTFLLAHPGSVALVLLFGCLGAAVSVNALWMQSEHHPAPLFHQAALQPQHAPPAAPKKAPEAQAAATAPASEDIAPAILPPSRPAGLGRAPDPGASTPAKPVVGKHPAKDPIADLLGGTPPVPPAPIKPAGGKAQSVEKLRPGASAPPADALAALIEQTTRSR